LEYLYFDQSNEVNLLLGIEFKVFLHKNNIAEIETNKKRQIFHGRKSKCIHIQHHEKKYLFLSIAEGSNSSVEIYISSTDIVTFLLEKGVV